MISRVFNNYFSWMIYSISLAIIIVLINPYLIITFILIAILAAVYYFGEKVLLGLILLNYLTGLTEYIGNLRIYLNLLSTMILIYLFIKKYGLRLDEYPKIPYEIAIFLIVLFTSLSVSALFSSYMGIGFTSILTMLLFFLITYLFYALLKNEENIYIYIYSISISVLVVAVRIFIDLFTLGIQDFFKKAILEGNSELAGSTGYTGFTIFFISTSFISAFLFMDKSKNAINKLLLTLILIINIVTLIFANSRAAILATILSISFMFLILKWKPFIKTFLIILLVLLGLFFTIPAVEETINLYVRIDSINQREVFWETGSDVISDYPILGVGPGSFYKYFFSYAPGSLFDLFYLDIWRYGKPSPHNLFLHYWSENGILGFILSISLFVLFFYFAFKTIKLTKGKNRDNYIISIAITGIGIGFLFRAFFEVTGLLYYGYITTDLPFWLLFGILLHFYQDMKSHAIQLAE